MKGIFRMMSKEFRGGPHCDVCCEKVSPNDIKQAGDMIFHSGCFKCATCNKPLDVTNFGEDEGLVYCRSCFSKHFRPKTSKMKAVVSNIQKSFKRASGGSKGTLVLSNPAIVQGQPSLHPGNYPAPAAYQPMQTRSHPSQKSNQAQQSQKLQQGVYPVPPQEGYIPQGSRKLQQGVYPAPQGSPLRQGSQQLQPGAYPPAPQGSPVKPAYLPQGSPLKPAYLPQGSPVKPQVSPRLQPGAYPPTPQGSPVKPAYIPQGSPRLQQGGYPAPLGSPRQPAYNVPQGSPLQPQPQFRSQPMASVPGGQQPGNTGAMRQYFMNEGDPDSCPGCGRKVYHAELLQALDRKWHRVCFKCVSCRRSLDLTTCMSHNRQPYCRYCYARESVVWARSAPQIQCRQQMETLDFDGPGNCPCCGRTVFFAEQYYAMGRKWHQSCFRCAHCRKPLKITNSVEHDGNPYCRQCHARNFAINGYGYAGGAAGLQLTAGQPPMVGTACTNGQPIDVMNKNNCPSCGYIVYHAEQVVALGRKWHTRCFKCSSCARHLNVGDSLEHSGKAFCQNCHMRMFGLYGRPGLENNVQACMASQRPAQNGCPYCGREVFHAERVMAMGKAWHDGCFRCNACQKKLRVTNSTQHEGMPYCRNCHAQSFGMRAYGFAGGQAGMAMYAGQPERLRELPLKPCCKPVKEPVDFNNPDYCPFCGRPVFFAEQIIYNSRKCHKKCFKCVSCARILAFGEHDNHGEKPYCSQCYNRNFVSFAHNMHRVDRRGDKPDQDHPLRCAGCGYKVFHAEQVVYGAKLWHKNCFRCASCQRALDKNRCTEHETKTYCNVCYARYVGPVGYGYASGGAGPMMGVGQAKAPSAGDNVKWEDPNCCRRCHAAISFVDQWKFSDRKWHKWCFKCVNCTKILTTSRAYINENELYCGGCYKGAFLNS